MRCVWLLVLLMPTGSKAADLWQIPAIVAGKRVKGSDWKAAAKLEGIVQSAAQKAGHNLTALSGDAGKKALACKGNVDCLAQIAAGKPGYATVIVVWALKRKRLGEVALFDLATMDKIGGASGPINAKLGAALVAAIPAPAPPPVKEVKAPPAAEPAPPTPVSAETPKPGEPVAAADAASPAAAESGLAVLNLKAQRSLEAGLAEMISEATLSHLRTTGRFSSVIGSSDVATMISAEQQKMALGCDDDSCLAEIGGALGVPYLLSGSLGNVGSRYMLNIKLLAVEEAKVAGRITQTFTSEDAIVDGLNAALDSLLNDAFGAPKTTTAKPAAAASPRRWSQWAGLGLGVGDGLGSNLRLGLY